MCNCGCNTCETKGPLLTEGKVKSLLSEGLQYHIDKKIPLFETVYRIGSEKHLSLIKEARKMYSRNVIDLCEEDEHLIRTHLGEFALYEGESVPLDLPMLNEAYYEVVADLGDKKAKENLDSFEEVQDFMDKMVKRNAISVDVTKFDKDKKQSIKYNWTGDKWEKVSKSDINESYDYDEVAQSEFGMDYDQLGSGEKEWVRDEIDNMSMNEDRKYNQEELLRLDLIARRRFDCDYKNCTDEQKAEVLKDKIKVGVKEAIEEKLKGIDGKACWKGYKLAGTKKKGGKTVDNCVPMEEAEFKGKEVALGKPKRGGPKAYYVYVKDGDKVKKVTFGSGGLRAKIKNKEARNAFAARHKCSTKKDRTKAGYWSCNLPRYAPALGLGAKMNTFW